MGRGIVVLSGTGEIIDERVKCQLSAVFRRIHREAHLSWMSKPDICRFFRQFLTRFVPACADAEWAHWEQAFMVDDGPWSSRDITIDMLKQFLMHQITEASCSRLGDLVPAACAGTNEFNVQIFVHKLCGSKSFEKRNFFYAKFISTFLCQVKAVSNNYNVNIFRWSLQEKISNITTYNICFKAFFCYDFGGYLENRML